uniref:Guanylate kinase n=1 Tax=candidate division WOR-3 bacterium TaxID=2052148 RepID=A0A7C3J5A6_UNCW3
MSNRGFLLILSSPSGGGKTTLCKMILENVKDTVYSVSATTREKRKGEVDGKDYFFLSEDEFLKKEKEGFFAETAMVHGKRYGTPKKFIEDMVKDGKIVVMDIDVVGAMNIMKKYPNSVSIFIMPPSFQELEERLRRRSRDKDEDIKIRLENAKKEIEFSKHFKYTVVNENLYDAFQKIKEIIENEKRRI